jgi:urease accessory protein
MIRIEHDAPKAAQSQVTLTLPFELRQKSRLRVRLDDGVEAGLFLARGRVLRGGDRLLTSDGRVVGVVAAAEQVSTVTASAPGALLRAAYHLGNRHVPVQVGEGFLRYGHDHVLDDMVRGLGLQVTVEMASFEPEGGAYAHGHSHTHGHAHGEHDHAHDHAHDHGGHEDAHGEHSHAGDGHSHAGGGHDHARPRIRLARGQGGPR